MVDALNVGEGTHACDSCAALAAFRNPAMDEVLCEACCLYLAGQQHGRAILGRAMLSEGVSELIAAGISEEGVRYACEAEIEGKPRPLGPESQYPQDPRPFVRLFVPITEEGS